MLQDIKQELISELRMEANILLLLSSIKSMSQISFINAYSLNPYENIEMKKRYLRHKNKIEQISKKTSNLHDIEIQQLRIISAIRKSKEMARKFQIQEFNLRRNNQNKRMINLLSRCQNKRQIESPANSPKKSREQIMRKFQMQLQEKNRNERIQQYSVDRKQYRKKIKKQISEYQRLRSHLQKFKSPNNKSRLSSREMSTLSNKKVNYVDASLFRQGKTEPAQLSKSNSLPPLHIIV